MVIIKARLPHCQNPRIGLDDFPDPVHIPVFRCIGSMGMDTGGAIEVMGLHEIIDQFIFLPVGAGQDTPDACILGLGNNLFRVREGAGKEIEPYIVIFYIHRNVPL